MNLISKLAPFSIDGERELCHFLFCQLLAKKKLNKSGHSAGRKQMSPSSEGLTSYSSMIHTISQDEPECSASACFLHWTWWAVFKMWLTVALHLVFSPLAARTDNSCPIALLWAWTGIRKAWSKIKAWWALHTQQVVSMAIRTGPHLHHTIVTALAAGTTALDLLVSEPPWPGLASWVSLSLTYPSPIHWITLGFIKRKTAV